MQIINKPLKDLKPYEKNPRRNDGAVDAVALSIKEFGFKVPVVIDSAGTIIAGHTRLKAAKKLKLTDVPCLIADDLTDEQIKAYRLADNKTSELSDWDLDALSIELDELSELDFDMSPFGFDGFSEPSKQETFDIEQAMNEISVKDTICKTGDVWLLGDHRLMCGDSTNPNDIEKLMAGQCAQLTVTSPPYGVGKEYEEKGIGPWFHTMRPVIQNICRHSSVVVWNLLDLLSTDSQFIEPTSAYSITLFNECGFKPIWVRIWEKPGLNFSTAPYHLSTNKPAQQYEYIQAYAAPDYKFVRRLQHSDETDWGYYGIWKIDTVAANKEHPAMYPVELPTRCIKMHSDERMIVLEPFAGSGTTIIAAEQLGRRCYAMEISPVYCDLAIQRWERLTNKTAVLAGASDTR